MYVCNLSHETTSAKKAQSYKEGLVEAFRYCSSKLTKESKNDVVFEVKMAWKALKRFWKSWLWREKHVFLETLAASLSIVQNYCYEFDEIVRSRTCTLSEALYIILFIYKLNQIGDKTKPLYWHSKPLL